jgi:UDP-glucose 4-epimerase
MKILITGGAGFIGSRLIKRLLSEGIEVHVFDIVPIEKALRLRNVRDNVNFNYTCGDLRDKKLLESWYKKDASHLYHLASIVGVRYYMDDPLALIDIVIGGTRNLLELATKYKTRVLFTSTSEVYGKNNQTPWKENDDRVLGPPSVDRWSYSTSKSVCEHMLFALGRNKGLKFTTVRFFNVYGPGQAPIFVASQSIYKVLRNERPLIYDEGEQTRCFTYVDDAIDGVIKASRDEGSVGEVLNIGSQNETCIAQLVDLIIKTEGKDLKPINFETRKEYGSIYEDISRRIPDVSKAKELINWQANTPLEEGIEKTIIWAKSNPWWLR